MSAGEDQPERHTIYGPVACVIRIQGTLDPRWTERLGGLKLTVTGAGATSELRGELLDQSALMGVLNTLHNQRLALLGVTCVPAHPAASGAAGA